MQPTPCLVDEAGQEAEARAFTPFARDSGPPLEIMLSAEAGLSRQLGSEILPGSRDNQYPLLVQAEFPPETPSLTKVNS